MTRPPLPPVAVGQIRRERSGRRRTAHVTRWVDRLRVWSCDQTDPATDPPTVLHLSAPALTRRWALIEE